MLRHFDWSLQKMLTSGRTSGITANRVSPIKRKWRNGHIRVFPASFEPLKAYSGLPLVPKLSQETETLWIFTAWVCPTQTPAARKSKEGWGRVRKGKEGWRDETWESLISLLVHVWRTGLVCDSLDGFPSILCVFAINIIMTASACCCSFLTFSLHEVNNRLTFYFSRNKL